MYSRSGMQHYLDNDLKLRKFVPIIQRSLVYPVILDAKRTVLSLPPIINGAHSAVSPSHCNYYRNMLSCSKIWHASLLILWCTMLEHS